MFQTDKTRGVWIFDTHQEAFIYYFPTFQDALKFLASHQKQSCVDFDVHNAYLDDINLGNDKKFYWYKNPCWKDEVNDYLNDGYIYTKRKYIFVDDDNRYIDFRLYNEEIENLAKTGDIKYECIPKQRTGRGKPSGLIFRVDPVPGTGLNRHHCKWLRHIKTTNEKRQNSDPEVESFIRPARRSNNLPSLYDDIPRHCSRSWKDNKKRKQWM